MRLGSGILNVMVYDPDDSLDHCSHSEIKNQSNRFLRKNEIRFQLFSINRSHLFRRLKFHYNRIINQYINSEAFVKMQTVVIERNFLLPFYGMSAPLQLCCKNRLVNRFEQSRTNLLVKLD